MCLQIVMLNSLSDLHGYVDKGQLTRELGGSLEYCHSQWIHHRTVSEHTALNTAYPNLNTHDLAICSSCMVSCILGCCMSHVWIFPPKAIENFAMTVKTTAQMLQKFGTDLAETELPNDVQCTKDLLTAHTDKHSNLKVV